MRLNTIGVVGGGTMGQGIAETLAEKGLNVLLLDVSEEKSEEAIRQIEVRLNRQMKKWAITAAEKKLILSRITIAHSIESFKECELVIETIPEDYEAKKKLFLALDKICPAPTILASNTSSLSLSELAEGTTSPERVIGLHFIYPVHRIELVEIIRGVRTSDDTFEIAKNFVDQTLEKSGVMIYESPGFVSTRLSTILINEALHTLQEGVASAEEIDAAMKLGYKFAYGPIEMADRFGLDSVLYALERMFQEFGDLKYRPSVLLKRKVRAGLLGTKTGEGFFRYDKDGVRIS